MLSSDISLDLKTKIEGNQLQMREAIRKHQKLFARFNEGQTRDPQSLQDEIEQTQQHIVIIGLEQKGLVERLRKEYKQYERNFKAGLIQNGVEDRRSNLSHSIASARKQNISFTPKPEPREETPEILSTPITPEPHVNYPQQPQDMNQLQFLHSFGLATHELYQEIQTKRAERKRRRTANPQFLYTRGWDMPKRKRKTYLASNVSPPNTRQSSKNRRGVSPPLKTSRPSTPDSKKGLFSHSWPKGLTIERIKTDPDDAKVCAECNKPDNLLNCDICASSFHVSCHNRPLNQTPKHCPKCLKTLLAHEAEFNDKLSLRTQLFDKNKQLVAEGVNLHDRHSELELALKTQDDNKKELVKAQDAIEDRIHTLISITLHIKENEFKTPFKSTRSQLQTGVDIDLTNDDEAASNAQSTLERLAIDIKCDESMIIDDEDDDDNDEKKETDEKEFAVIEQMDTLQVATAEEVQEHIIDDMPAPVLQAETSLFI